MASCDDCMVLIVMGMAGSGKTTFVSKMTEHLRGQGHQIAIVNLDPAVLSLPYTPDIDIRTEVSYADVRRQYNLGPNGGILTCFNIFATNFQQVMEKLEDKFKESKYIVVDTPGQIEVFTWSASGAIITDMLASSYPVAMTYLLDTPRNQRPTTFVSNMLHACSIHAKSLLPFLLVFNKTDLKDSSLQLAWMQDFEALAASFEGSGYVNNLTRSLSLALDDYYSILKTCSVSSVTGNGMLSLQEQLQDCKLLYMSEYKKLQEERQKIHQKAKDSSSSSSPPSSSSSSSTLLPASSICTESLK